MSAEHHGCVRNWAATAVRRTFIIATRQAGAQVNAMGFIIETEIYDHLEKVVDRFEDVSNEINALVVDHL